VACWSRQSRRHLSAGGALATGQVYRGQRWLIVSRRRCCARAAQLRCRVLLSALRYHYHVSLEYHYHHYLLRCRVSGLRWLFRPPSAGAAAPDVSLHGPANHTMISVRCWSRSDHDQHVGSDGCQISAGRFRWPESRAGSRAGSRSPVSRACETRQRSGALPSKRGHEAARFRRLVSPTGPTPPPRRHQRPGGARLTRTADSDG
jgi:hypothetical protein